MSNKILAITGMHRSGTSLIAQYLSLCGLSLGNNLTSRYSKSKDSAFGFHHEDMDFVKFHDALLNRRHVSALPTSRLRFFLPTSKAEKQRAAHLLAQKHEQADWGWKDPRTALFLDMWKNTDNRLVFLSMFRQPMAVVDSLLRRKADRGITKNPLIAVQAWRIYNQNILRFHHRFPDKSLLINVDRLVQAGDDIVPAINANYALDLKPIPFTEFFSQKALKTQAYKDNEQIQALCKNHRRVATQCQRLYEQLSESSCL